MVRMLLDLVEARPGAGCFQLDIPEVGMVEIIFGAKAVVLDQQVAVALAFQYGSGLGTKVSVIRCAACGQ